MTSGMTLDQVPKSVGGGRYDIRQKLGAGSFGAVYRGLDVETRAPVAVKIEDGRTQQLQKELEVLRTLQGENEQTVQGFARILYFGRKGGQFCLVMECLGKSLEERLKACGGRFNAKTTVLIAEQMLACIELLHSKGVVHRDIKPDNFMCGVAERRHHLYLIDFGLAEWYWQDGTHVPMRKEDEFKGTMRYASASAQRYFTQSRRDDLEAACHTWLYFLNGSLPWSGLQAESKAEQFRKVREMKEVTSKSTLCAGQHRAFEEFLNYCAALGYNDRPDYSMLRRLFSSLRAELEQQAGEGRIEDCDFEWEGRSAGPLQALRPRVEAAQPDDSPERSPIRSGSAPRAGLGRRCPGCRAGVQWSTNCEGAYANGWQCDAKPCAHGRTSCGPGRWHCTSCSGDFCTGCVERRSMSSSEVGGSSAGSIRATFSLRALLGCGRKSAASEPAVVIRNPVRLAC